MTENRPTAHRQTPTQASYARVQAGTPAEVDGFGRLEGLNAGRVQTRSGRKSSPWLVMLATLALSGTCGSAMANPADLFGFGARAASMGNAFTAVADDPFATYYNVAGLVQIKRPTVGVGLQLGHFSLGDPNNCVTKDGVGCSETYYYAQGGSQTIQQSRYGYDDPHGVLLGIALPVFKKLNFGLSAYVPLNVQYDENGNLVGVGMRLARFKTIDPYLPDYVMFQNRSQRFGMYAGASYEIVPGLGIGLGVSVLANAQMKMDINGTVRAVTTQSESGESTTVVTTELNPLITLDLLPKSRPVAGIFWNLGTLSPQLAAWQLGLSYRSAIDIQGAAEISTDLAVVAQLSEDEAPLSYGATIEGLTLTFLDFYTPQQLAFGVSGRVGDRIRLAGDVTWNNWSSFKASVGELPDQLELMLGLSLNLAQARALDLSGVKDTIVPRVGIEGRLGPYMSGSALKGMDVYLRGGMSFEPNPFPLQTGLNNLLNSDRLVTSGGIGVTTLNPFVKGKDLPVSLDMSAQYHYLFPTVHQKDIEVGTTPPDGYPVDGSYTSQGSVFQGALTLQMGF